MIEHLKVVLTRTAKFAAKCIVLSILIPLISFYVSIALIFTKTELCVIAAALAVIVFIEVYQP